MIMDTYRYEAAPLSSLYFLIGQLKLTRHLDPMIAYIQWLTSAVVRTLVTVT